MILIIIFETSWLIVLVKVGLQCKWLITFPALVVLKSCMSLHVSSQVWPVSKTFTTMCTTKGFISSVRSEIDVSIQMNRFCLPQMSFEKPWSWKSFSTCVTLVVEVMCQDVHGESWHAHIHLPTNATFLGCVCVQAEVSLLVPVSEIRIKESLVKWPW